MHFHLPKPLHGWREFAGEVGIIVVGVLIALGAEQLVERFHQRAELHQAEDAMRSELRDDDLPQAYARAVVFNCYSQQLDAIEQAATSGDRAKVLSLASAYKPLQRTWDDQAWQSAIASQVLIQSGSQRMINWANAYVMTPFLSRTTQEEQDALPQLTATLSGNGPLSSTQQDQLFHEISVLKKLNRQMMLGSLGFIQFVGARGLKLTAAEEGAILTDGRKKIGTCVGAPRTTHIDVTSQFSTGEETFGKQ
jgi:hypothetical protein